MTTPPPFALVTTGLSAVGGQVGQVAGDGVVVGVADGGIGAEGDECLDEVESAVDPQQL